MLSLGTVKPGRTLYIPFESFAGSTGAPITLTNFATSDVKCYKDGSTTERASANGVTLLATTGVDFDSITGIHGFSIDLADNTTAGFWSSGSTYFVVVSTVTVDSQTLSFLAAHFRIGYDGAVLNTTIATLATQTSFTLTAGPAEDDALNGAVVVIHDVASAVQQSFAVVADYTGSTKTVTLVAAPTFTMTTTDNVSLFPPALQPTVPGRTFGVETTGKATGVVLTDTVTTYTSNTPQTGDNFARLGVNGAGLSAIPDLAGVTTLLARLSAARAGYLDNVNNATLSAAVFPTDPADHSLVIAATNAITSAIAALNNLSAAGVENAVWNAVLASHLTGGSTGAALNAAGSSGDPWGTALPGAYSAGSAGKILGDNLNATVSSRLATAGYTAPLDAPGTRTAVGLASANLDTQLDALPTAAELATSLSTADDATLVAIAALNNLSVSGVRTAVGLTSANLDTQLAAIQSDADNIQTRLPAALVAGRMDANVGAMATATVTAAALAADAVTALQSGVSTLTAAGVRTAVGLASANLDTQLTDLPTNAELATALGTADDATLAAIAALNNLSQAQVRTAVGLASANLDTQLDALPTAAELATALAAADDATLTAIAALNNLSAAQVNAEADTALLDAGLTAAIQADLDNLQTRVPAALIAGRIDASVGALNGSATAAQNLERSASAIYRGSITSVSTSTNLFDSGLTQTGTDHWKGRIVIFTSGALAGQATDILAFTPPSDTLTVTALTAAPAVSDQFVIV